MVSSKDKRVQSLLAGEKVKLFGTVRFYIFWLLHTLGSLLILAFLGLVVKDFNTQEWSPLGISEIPTLALELYLIFFLFYSTAVYWGSLLFGATRFADDHFTFWDWRNRSYRIPLSNLLALWQEKIAITRLCYLRSEDKDQIAYLNLRGNMRWKKTLAEAIRNELLGKCHLVKLAPEKQSSDNQKTIWLKPDLPNLSSGKYEISWIPRYVYLFSGIAALLIGIPLLTYWFYHRRSEENDNFLPIMLIFLGGWAINTWWRERWKLRLGELRAVEWDDRLATLHTRDNSRKNIILALPWSDIEGITLPASLGGGVAELQVSGKESPYKLLLMENINCLALLNILRNKGLISWKQAAD